MIWPPPHDAQVPLLIFLAVLLVLGLLAFWGYWHGAWEPPPPDLT